MKYLLILLIPLKIFSQDTIRTLPVLVNEGTYTLTEEAFIQSVDEEIEQRRRFKKIRKLALQKQKLEYSADSLLVNIKSLESERDSLVDVINKEIQYATDEVKSRILYLEDELRTTWDNYQKLLANRRKIKKRLFFSFSGNVILVLLLFIAI